MADVARRLCVERLAARRVREALTPSALFDRFTLCAILISDGQTQKVWRRVAVRCRRRRYSRSPDRRARLAPRSRADPVPQLRALGHHVARAAGCPRRAEARAAAGPGP